MDDHRRLRHRCLRRRCVRRRLVRLYGRLDGRPQSRQTRRTTALGAARHRRRSRGRSYPYDRPARFSKGGASIPAAQPLAPNRFLTLNGRIGAPNQRKWLSDNDISLVRAPRRWRPRTAGPYRFRLTCCHPTGRRFGFPAGASGRWARGRCRIWCGWRIRWVFAARGRNGSIPKYVLANHSDAQLLPVCNGARRPRRSRYRRS
jgi:hypothetical protein